MKAALIPPNPDLPTFGHGSFHLLLSHLIGEMKQGVRATNYSKHYKEERRRGAYLVLDNSAHEFSAGQAADTLFEQAYKMRAQEVVVPDVLESCEGTIEGALEAIETWVEGPNYLLFQDLNPTLMYVPQGENEGAWLHCLTELIRIHAYTTRRHSVRSDFVIGISKDYEMWDGGTERILSQYVKPLVEKSPVRIHVHMLGWGRNLWELKRIAQLHPWVRSTDSAKPFVYARRNISLDPGLPAPPYPTRPKDYFQSPLTPSQKMTAAWNVGVFKRTAEGQ